ncbi:CrcB-like protein-domain-containing protein [Mycena sp. CBHHK59/15]|nr:CrcB-like protein-domain-containing protein [Mycena sp. CBHHK59/15]
MAPDPDPKEPVVVVHPKVYAPLSPYVLTLLMPFSVFGLLARLGLRALATYSGQSIFSLAYVQAVGCLLMGFCLALKEPFGRYYPPAYTALVTGFCGSLTTFSSWQLDVFKSWVNIDGDHRSGLSDFMDGLGKSVFTMSISMSSLFFGMFLAGQTSPYFQPAAPPSKLLRRSVSALAVCTYFATLPAYFLLPASFRHQATAALLFSFPGTLTRYLLGIALNPIHPTFPLGTFAANAFGTALLGALRVLQSMSAVPASRRACALLQGLADGYCGCLTTISTFAAELAVLKGWHKWRYGLATWAAGQLLLCCIFGALLWAKDIQRHATCVFD